MQKRIAMISFHTCPLASEEGKETGGMNVYVLELSRQLAQNGFFVDIFTRSQDQKNKKIVTLTPTLRVIHIPAGPEKIIAKKNLGEYIPEFATNIFSFIQEENLTYNILHCHYYLSGLAGIDINKILPHPLPIIMTFHTLALMKNLVARNEMEKEEKERIDAEFLLIQHAQKIIAPSSSDKEYLIYLYNAPKEKIALITPGVDTSVFKPMDKITAKAAIKANKDDNIILFVGRIEPLKGIDVLMYAMKILREKNPSVSFYLWIVGGDVSQKKQLWSKELQKLEKLRHLLQMKTLVHFVGQEPQSRLPFYYNAAEVVVMPSHYESFGMAALEAMACGVPVITTNVSGIASLLDETHDSLITSANNPLLLASQIEALVTNQEKHTKVSKEVYEKVQDLDWKYIAQKVSALYNNLL